MGDLGMPARLRIRLQAQRYRHHAERRKTKDERRQRGLLFASIVDAKLALEALREHGITTAAHCTSITEFVEIACSALLW